MNFELTEEQNLIRDMVRSFAETEVAPSARERDEEERFDRALMYDRLGELGLTGIVFPEEYGGAGADYISYAIAVEELSRVCGSTGVTLSAHLSLCANPIYMFGTEAQKQKFLVPLAKGEKMGAFGLTEPSAGSDAGGTKTTATRDGNDWILNGSKIFITNAGEAETYVVLARSDKSAEKHRGISAYIVEKGTPGFSFGKKEAKMGIRSSPTMELVFENCRIPGDNLLGQEGQGFKVAMKTLDGGRIGIAAQALGIAQGALDAALAYTKEREQFNKPIAAFQGVSVPTGGHGHPDRGRPAADLQRRLSCQRRPFLFPGIGHGQALCQRDRHAGHHPVGPTPRRIWLYPRISGRADDARCQNHRDLRGDQRSPAGGYRCGLDPITSPRSPCGWVYPTC